MTVANGEILQCSYEMHAARWQVQGCEFTSALRVLPLHCYDLIVGMDWLEAHSPMKIHWGQKWMSISYEGSFVSLQGILPELPPNTLVQICAVTSTETSSQDSSIPPEIQALLVEFAAVFEKPVGLPPSRSCDHAIPLVPGAAPFNIRSYRYPPKLKTEIERQVQEMLTNGIIQHSKSPFSSPVLMVKKKDMSWRFCVDFRHLNALTVKSQFPIPLMEEILNELSHASWFSSLDLCSGFHQILLQPGESYKTAFSTHEGHFEFRVLAFGLSGAPATFQGAMNTTLKPLLRKCVMVFFDDILVYSQSFEQHVTDLRSVLQLLANDQWKVKLTKCSFAQRQLSYLGHVISAQGVATDPSKISAIVEWPSPANAKELRSFLGLAGYYRRFVKNFGVLSKPLTDLLKKNTIYVWTSTHELAFSALKHALCSALVLALPDFSKPFCVETDASGLGVGTVLMQEGHPLAFISKHLSPKNLGLSTYEKEYLAILMAIEQWRPYLQYGEFVIKTDQRSLCHLTDQRLNTPWQQKVFTKLLGLQYKIQYKQGVDNKVADALSHMPPANSELLAVSVVTPSWLHEMVDSYQGDSKAQDLLRSLATQKSVPAKFSLQQGIIRYKNKVWVGDSKELQLKIITAFHDSPLGGHSGIPVTIRRIKQLFYWKGLKASVVAFVNSCQVCQQSKPDRSKYPGLLQPLPVPSGAWQTVTMDFINGLPTSGHANCIMVIVDKFTRYSHFVPLRHPFTAATVA